MSWPRNTDYNEAIQNLRSTVSDEELREGQPALNPLGMPSPYSGNFADVYKVHCPKTGNSWAVKCFTREVPGLVQRYREIGTHLSHARLPFMVDFRFVEPGIRIGRAWYSFLKMRWVEGLNLNQFVSDHLDRPKMLKQFLGLWVKLSERLRKAEVAHADLQHGNVLLVPASEHGHLGVKLIDYDGMYVPALYGKRSGESGHAAYQHPQRSRERIFGAEVDRFPHLAIYTAIHCLSLEPRTLWHDFNNDDNLLFREADFVEPGRSQVFRALWSLQDTNAHALVGRLLLSCRMPLDQVPLLEKLIHGNSVHPLSREEERQANAVLDGAARPVPPRVPGVDLPTANASPPPLTGTASERSASERASANCAASTTPLEPETARGWATGQRLLREKKSRAAIFSYATTAAFVAVLSIVLFLGLRNGQRPPDHRADGEVAAKPSWPKDEDTKPKASSHKDEVEPSLVPGAPKSETPSPPGPELESIVDKAQDRGNETVVVEKPKPVDPTEEEPPELAVAPFDAAQAKAHQERWSKFLDVPSQETNSVGIKLVLIPPGEFLMGSADSEGDSNEHPQHRVRITKPFWMGAHEVTVGQFRTFADETKHANAEWRNAFPSQIDEQPVTYVSWDDVNAFLKWLSGKEGAAYRLPTEAEWEYACRAGTQTNYCFGDNENLLNDYAWYGNNAVSTTHPVGRKRPNAWGLYDMHGNLWEWCQDWFQSDHYSPLPADDPTGPQSAADHVLRGGSWYFTASYSRSANRNWGQSDRRTDNRGFRALRTEPKAINGTQPLTVTDPVKPPSASSTPPPQSNPAPPPEPQPLPPKIARKPGAPELATAPFDAAQAKAHQERWSKFLKVPSQETNSVGIKLVLIPPGEFLMGSADSEGDSNEHPQHRVRITKPFWMGAHEVTVGQFRKFADETKHANAEWRNAFPSQIDEQPVTYVSWGDVNAFLKWLSGKEGAAYRLPTEAEWEYACRAGTQTNYCFGDNENLLNDYAWYGNNAVSTTHPVGRKKPNAWGLYDMHGNLWEWCQDWFQSDHYSPLPADDPAGPQSATDHVLRGGSWYFTASYSRSANRNWGQSDRRTDNRGFRALRVEPKVIDDTSR